MTPLLISTLRLHFGKRKLPLHVMVHNESQISGIAGSFGSGGLGWIAGGLHKVRGCWMA